MRHSPWEIVDPYPVLVNHNASRHHPDENLCVTLVLKRGEQSVISKGGGRGVELNRDTQREREKDSTTARKCAKKFLDKLPHFYKTSRRC